MKETAAERKTTTDRIKLKVAYADFWGTFAPEQFGVLKILSRDFDLVMDQDDPDLLICSIFGSDAQKYKCPRVLFIGEAMSPNFRHYDYVIGCDRLSYPGRYLRLPVYLNLFRAETTLELTAKKHIQPEEFYRNRDKFCSFVVSSPFSKTGRVEFFEYLNARRHVASAGAIMNNMGGWRCEDKIAFLRNFRFNIAFENTIMDGYVTEKITDAFAAGCIPIYYGDPSIYQEFNKGSFINVADFASFEECVDYIFYVDGHPEVYESIVRTPAFAGSNTLRRTYEEDILAFFHGIVDSGFRIRRQPGMFHNDPGIEVSIVRQEQKKEQKEAGVLRRLKTKLQGD